MSRRASLVIALVGLFGLLLVAGPVLAATGPVTIGEADERYAFSPKDGLRQRRQLGHPGQRQRRPAQRHLG